MGLGGGTLLSGWMGTLVKGWTFVVTATAGTGLPETPIYSAGSAGTGVRRHPSGRYRHFGLFARFGPLSESRRL